MEQYTKPTIVMSSGVSEGVYTASGDGTPRCDSVYMLGVWQKGTKHGKGYKERFGCQGCQAYTGSGCKLASGNAGSLDPSGELKPAWERNGYGPYDTK